MEIKKAVMKWLGCQDDQLKQQIASRDENITELTETNNNLNEENTMLNDLIKNRNSEIAELKAAVLKTSEFQIFMDKQFPQASLLYRKRWIFDKDHIIELDPRTLIGVDLSLPQAKTLQRIWEYSITYVYDGYAEQGIPDYWQMSSETHALGDKGDCEDSSIMRINMARNIGIKNIFLGVGFYNKTIGHAFPVQFENGKLYVMEATNNIFERKPLNEKFENELYKVHYIISEDTCWTVDGSASFGALIEAKPGRRIRKTRR
jgi:hypothetical protein